MKFPTPYAGSYYPIYNSGKNQYIEPEANMPFDQISALFVAFAHAYGVGNDAAELRLENSQPHEPERLKGLVATARQVNPDIKILISLGWGHQDWSYISQDFNGQKVFTQSVIALIREYELDGFDIDDEGIINKDFFSNPDEIDLKNTSGIISQSDFDGVIQNLRETLNHAAAKDGKPYYLTITPAFTNGKSKALINNDNIVHFDLINTQNYGGSSWQDFAEYSNADMSKFAFGFDSEDLKVPFPNQTEIQGMAGVFNWSFSADSESSPTRNKFEYTKNIAELVGYGTKHQTTTPQSKNREEKVTMQKKTTLNETSANGPAISTNPNNLNLIAWTGTDNTQLSFISSSNGESFTNKVTLDETSDFSPSLTWMNGSYFVAWTGVDNLQLNILQSTDGQNWTQKVTLNETSPSAPSIIAVGNTLFLGWRGEDNRLNILQSTDGKNWTNKETLAETTTAGPALGTLGDTLYLSWQGVNNNQINMLQKPKGGHFDNKVTLNETTNARPALASLGANGETLYLAWQGEENEFLNLIETQDGINFSNKVTINTETCIQGPAITVSYDQVYWAWTGTNNEHNLNFAASSAIS